MRSSLMLLCLFSLSAVGSMGCAEEEDSSAPEGLLTEALRLRFNSGMDERARLVIRDEPAWKEAWARISNHGDRPAKIDFERHVVIVVAMGTQPTSGYAIGLESVEVSGATAAISVLEVSPDAGCGVLQETTAPLSVFVAPRFDGEATFVERTKKLSCRP